jgi:hypothetical protein
MKTGALGLDSLSLGPPGKCDGGIQSASTWLLTV